MQILDLFAFLPEQIVRSLKAKYIAMSAYLVDTPQLSETLKSSNFPMREEVKNKNSNH